MNGAELCALAAIRTFAVIDGSKVVIDLYGFGRAVEFALLAAYAAHHAFFSGISALCIA